MSTDETAPERGAPDGTDRPGDEALVLGPAQLKALAHPLRIEILEQLTTHGDLTASRLATLVGESSGSTSYHLRQLAKHGFVREVAGRGTGRERWWERRPGGFTVSLPEDPEDLAAVTTTMTVNREFEQARARRILALIDHPTALGRDWLEATRLQTTNLWLTATQATDLLEAWDRFSVVLDRYANQQDKPGARPVQVHFNLFPLVDGKENPS